MDIQRRELVRIAKSQPFARAVKLRQLVTWLGERAIQGQTPKPSEYLVGIEALGKPRDFDPSYDVSVRQLKRRMCARLAQYYSSEGRSARLRLVCERGFAVRFEWVAASEEHRPCVAVLPIQGDESGLLMGSLSHALMETEGLQVLSRSTVLADSPRRLIEQFGAGFFVEGEVLRGADHGWDLTLRLLDAPRGVVLSGQRLSGTGPVGAGSLRAAAAAIQTFLQEHLKHSEPDCKYA